MELLPHFFQNSRHALLTAMVLLGLGAYGLRRLACRLRMARD